MSELPLKNCYWVLPGRFLAGEYPRDKENRFPQPKIEALLQAGVTAFIDLTEAEEGLHPYADLLGPVSHQRFPIRDVSTPNSIEFTSSILDAIDQHIDQGRLVYLHCWGGIGRTGVIVGCWLSRHGYSGEMALRRLTELWQQCPKSATKQSPETEAQAHYIRSWPAGA